jgi:hypothetical protein
MYSLTFFPVIPREPPLPCRNFTGVCSLFRLSPVFLKKMVTLLFPTHISPGTWTGENYPNTPNHATYEITTITQTSAMRIFHPHLSQIPKNEGWLS